MNHSKASLAKTILRLIEEHRQHLTDKLRQASIDLAGKQAQAREQARQREASHDLGFNSGPDYETLARLAEEQVFGYQEDAEHWAELQTFATDVFLDKFTEES